jgi:hypothetical protein
MFFFFLFYFLFIFHFYCIYFNFIFSGELRALTTECGLSPAQIEFDKMQRASEVRHHNARRSKLAFFRRTTSSLPGAYKISDYSFGEGLDSTHRCVYICVYICMCIYMCIYICMCVYICIYIYICVCVCMNV